MIKKYKNWISVNEKISFERYCESTKLLKKLIIEKYGGKIEDAQLVMNEILDTIGHIPSFFQIYFHSNGWWLDLDVAEQNEYFGDGEEFDEQEDEDHLKACIKLIRDGEKISLHIKYQTPCDANEFKATPLTEELELKNKEVRETLNGMGCDFITTETTQDGRKVVWSYVISIPIQLKLSDSLDEYELPSKIVTDFKNFIKKYNIPKEGEIEISKIIRNIL